ncbi:MAG: metalloregulator ArsR/SmtB family transcription factor [Bacteroidetes bacterium]|nr:metalloregulator ArsR/SmtB family transcription factor [Bacteroidota bacterium]
MRIKHFNLSSGTQMFKALSDESRVRILNLILKNGEMCISDLELVLDFTQTKTSRHLTYLKNAGILTFRKIDQWAFYCIKDEVTDIINQQFNYLQKDTTLTNDLETYRELYENEQLGVCKLRIRE